jgi:lipopolysaccharide export system permease protein
MKLLDIYILRQFVSTLFFAVCALILIFIVVDLVEHLDDFIDKKASTQVIIEFYVNYIPWMLKLLVPIGMLVAALFSIGKLSNLSEIIAMRSGGISLFRLMLPILFFSIVISFGQLYFNGWIIPETNKRKVAIEQQYLGGSGSSTTLSNLYLRDTPLRTLIMEYYNGSNKQGTKVTVEEYSDEIHPRMMKRIDAETIRWDSIAQQWIVMDCIERVNDEGVMRSQYYSRKNIQLKMSHHDIMQLQRSPEEMNLDEVKQYLTVVSQGGKDVRRQLIDYYGQYAFPFSNVIVVSFGVAFASVRRRNGLALQIAAAMIVSFVYLVF